MRIARAIARSAVRGVLTILIVIASTVAVMVALDRRARDTDKIRVIEVPFVVPGSDALTAGRVIFIRSDKAESPDLLAHELIHVCQWEEQGIKFLWNYSKEYGQNFADLKGLDGAYVDVSFEQQARRGHADCDFDRYAIQQP
jgi:hypothetical protein